MRRSTLRNAVRLGFAADRVSGRSGYCTEAFGSDSSALRCAAERTGEVKSSSSLARSNDPDVHQATLLSGPTVAEYAKDMRPSSEVQFDASRPAEIRQVLAEFRGPLLWLILFSGVINLLTLTGAIFMLEVYDRVLPSGSVPTLVALAVLAATLFSFQAMLDILRSRVFVRVGSSLATALGTRTYDAIVRMPLRGYARGDGLQPLRDLEQIRSFVAGGGLVAFFDLPWIPFYIAFCFAFHLWIGVTATAGAALLLAATVSTEILTRKPMQKSSSSQASRNGLAQASRRNAEVLQAMGMAARISRHWTETHHDYVEAQQRASDVSGGIGALSKALRVALQSAVLGTGAYLVIHGEATAGLIIAGSILSARALAPVELAIANWRSFQAARQAERRLRQIFAELPPCKPLLALPRPSSYLSVEGVSVNAPGTSKVLVRDVSFKISAGSALGIIGPSASGKSSLVRALVGAWQPAAGKIRLDGAALDQWSSDTLGSHVGYLPQDIELFDGTIAQNIARFDPDPAPEKIIAAASAAGVNEMILRMPEGYETRIGEGGAALSAGQRQRIGLARALYGDPFLVVLDEPNSNLDGEGEEALKNAIVGIRNRGGVAVIVAHRPTALANVNKLLLLADGRVQALGPTQEVFQQISRPNLVAAGARP